MSSFPWRPDHRPSIVTRKAISSPTKVPILSIFFFTLHNLFPRLGKQNDGSLHIDTGASSECNAAACLSALGQRNNGSLSAARLGRQCQCQCPIDRPIYREDLKLCVSTIDGNYSPHSSLVDPWLIIRERIIELTWVRIPVIELRNGGGGVRLYIDYVDGCRRVATFWHSFI